LGSISERRIYLLLSGKQGLPEFLTPNPGLESGMMIPQYAAASLASLNKQLCTPSSADSITSSNGQEDHVSMGANAALKALMVADNVEQIMAIEWITAVQAIRIRRSDSSYPIAPALEPIFNEFEAIILPSVKDRIMAKEIATTRNWLCNL
jgi:histidine ammonia-lyase